jgi:uncharacterized protein
MSELVAITLGKIMQSKSYTAIILGTEKKQFAIYTEPQVGRQLQLCLSPGQKMRPKTADLIHSIFKGLNVKVVQAVINHLEDTLYFSRLFLEQRIGEEIHILEIDARPSDCITLALMHEAPLYCKREVFEQAVPINI